MNATLKMWEVPKGQFDSALKRLGQVFGEGFGALIDRLNKDKSGKYASEISEAIKEPEKAFLRQLIQHLGMSITLEQIQESISMQCSAETDRLYDRALRGAQNAYPRLVEPFGTSRWEFISYALGLIRENGGGGPLAIQHLVFELGLRWSIIECLDTNKERPYHWSLLDSEPSTPHEKYVLILKFWDGRPCLNLFNEFSLSKVANPRDQMYESIWHILKHEAHIRRPR
ncbi:MAG: hypothetical protein WCQ60_03015 [bacterium]